MKRPEGFDPATDSTDPQKRRSERRQPRSVSPTEPRRPMTRSLPASPTVRPSIASALTAQKVPQRAKPVGATSTPVPTRRDVRRAGRERRRYERREVRRFTTRTRNRRWALTGAGLLMVGLVGLVVVAVFSPILALRHIDVVGTARVDAGQVQSSLSQHLGTPLALLDEQQMTRELGAFPLVRSLSTQLVPPDTMIVHITEREPVGSVRVSGGYDLVDPAGVTLEQSAERIPGVPLIDVRAGDRSAPPFRAIVDVLLSMPADLRARVDSASAMTPNSVILGLDGVGQSVTWGSAERSSQKSALLAALISVTDPAQVGRFDVSAPENGIFHAG